MRQIEPKKIWGVFDPDGNIYTLSPMETAEQVWEQAASQWLYFGLFGMEKSIREMQGHGYQVLPCILTPEIAALAAGGEGKGE